MKKLIIGIALVVAIGIVVKIAIYYMSDKTKTVVVDCERKKQELFANHVKNLYKTVHLDTTGLNFSVFEKAMNGYSILKSEGQVSKPILSIVDFQKPSSAKRLWVIDLENKELLFNSLVAHGRGTGELTAESFSNEANSNMSSLGFYVTSDLYNGKHGLSLIVDGMEKGFNDSARSRSIVVHGADYVSENFVKKVGRLGRSLGCPAIPKKICNDVVCTICDRSVLFIYYPDKKYLAQSAYLNKEAAYEAYARQNAFTCSKYKDVAFNEMIY